MLLEHYLAVRYGDIIVFLYHEDMQSVVDLLFNNSQREKLLKRFLEYWYMIDVKVAFEGLKVVRNYKYYTLLTLFWLIDAVILIIDEAYISDKREMREGADWDKKEICIFGK